MGSIIHHKNNNKQSETYTNSWNSITSRTIPSSRVEQSANLLNPPSFTGVQAAYTALLRGSLRETSWQESVSGQSLIKPNSGGSIRERFSSFPDLSSDGKRASPLVKRDCRGAVRVTLIQLNGRIRVNLTSQSVIHAFRWSLRLLGDTLYVDFDHLSLRSRRWRRINGVVDRRDTIWRILSNVRYQVVNWMEESLSKFLKSIL